MLFDTISKITLPLWFPKDPIEKHKNINFNDFLLSSEQTRGKHGELAINMAINLFNITVACHRNIMIAEKKVWEFNIYYQLATDRDFPFAQNNLAWCYANGFGTDRDAAKAFKYFLLAADQNWPDAKYNLGLCWQYGYGTKKDIWQAGLAFKDAAKLGHKKAKAALRDCGEHYFLLATKEENLGAVASIMELAVDLDHPTAQCLMGWYYEHGYYGVKQSNEKALEYYMLSADQNEYFAQYDLGLFYRNQGQSQQDAMKKLMYYEIALKWFELAAKHKIRELEDDFISFSAETATLRTFVSSNLICEDIEDVFIPARMTTLDDIAYIAKTKNEDEILKRLIRKEQAVSVEEYEQVYILEQKALEDYYQTMKIKLSNEWISSAAIHSGNVKNSAKKAIDYLPYILDQTGKYISLPGFRFLLKMLMGAITVQSARQKQAEINRVVSFFDPNTALESIESISRELTLLQEREILRLASCHETKSNYINNCFAAITVNDIDNSIKRRALEDFNKIKNFILCGSLNSKATSKDIQQFINIAVGANTSLNSISTSHQYIRSRVLKAEEKTEHKNHESIATPNSLLHKKINRESLQKRSIFREQKEPINNSSRLNVPVKSESDSIEMQQFLNLVGSSTSRVSLQKQSIFQEQKESINNINNINRRASL